MKAKKIKTPNPKNYAIIIGTNDIGKPDWGNLKNRVNDAKAVEAILKNKYNFEVKSMYNMPLFKYMQQFLILKIKLESMITYYYL